MQNVTKKTDNAMEAFKLITDSVFKITAKLTDAERRDVCLKILVAELSSLHGDLETTTDKVDYTYAEALSYIKTMALEVSRDTLKKELERQSYN